MGAVLYIARSIDGYIAGINGEMTFLDSVDVAGEDYGYFSFIKEVDAVVLGRTTFDWVFDQIHKSPHENLPCFVITSRPKEAMGKTQFVDIPAVELIAQLKKQGYQKIFIDGGSRVVNDLLDSNEIDSMIISEIPMILGGGVPLFRKGNPQSKWKTVSSRLYPSGLLQTEYIRIA